MQLYTNALVERKCFIKGGHLKGKSPRYFVNQKRNYIFKNKKLKTINTHGTGCTLSSAITTFLGCGKPIDKSCELGIRYVNNAIDLIPIMEKVMVRNH